MKKKNKKKKRKNKETHGDESCEKKAKLENE